MSSETTGSTEHVSHHAVIQSGRWRDCVTNPGATLEEALEAVRMNVKAMRAGGKCWPLEVVVTRTQAPYRDTRGEVVKTLNFPQDSIEPCRD